MDHKSPQNNRLYMLAGFLAVVLAIYVGVLYNTQVIKYDEYQEKSIRSIARVEKPPGVPLPLWRCGSSVLPCP